MFVYYNPNPLMKLEDDCVIRALCKALGTDWDTTYTRLCVYGYKVKGMPSLNHVWGGFLKENGYARTVLPNQCPECYTVEDFEGGHPHGTYLVATGSHVVAVVDGNHYDTWDSGNEIVLFYWTEDKDGRETESGKEVAQDVQQGRV